jgi:hypothetical protein
MPRNRLPQKPLPALLHRANKVGDSGSFENVLSICVESADSAAFSVALTHRLPLLQ